MEHGGRVGGFLSFLNILPDQKIGIFTSINTGYVLSFIHAFIHLYSYDLLLGKKPFFNLTDLCPGGKFGNLDHKSWPTFKHDLEISNQIKVNKVPFPSVRNTERTIGSYQNFAYGNVTVYRNTTDQEIYMSYGPFVYWRLERTGEDLTFTGHATLPLWSLTVELVEFKDCEDKPCERVTTSFESDDLPTFYRNPGPEPNPEPPCTND